MVLFYSYLALGAFLVSLLGTRLMILALRKKNPLLHQAGASRRMIVPPPRGAGLAVVFAVAIFLLPGGASYELVFGTLLLAAVALLDDWIRLALATRLCAQLAAVLIALHAVQVPLLTECLPPWAANAVIVGGWLWLINLFHSMDGIDGIAAAEMISVGGGVVLIAELMGTFTSSLSLQGLIVLGAGFGFLWWNWHRAKILLGSVGSVPIGYLLGYLLLEAAQSGYVFAALILPAYYVADASLTALTRLWRREKTREHFYEQAVRGGLRQDAVVVIVFGINMLLAMLASLAELDPHSGWLYLSIAYGMVVAVLYFAMAAPRPEKAKRS